MARKLFFLLIIALISCQTSAQLEISFELIEKIYEWVMKIYETIEKYNNPDKSSENIESIMKQVTEVSTKLNALENHLDIKLDEMLNLLLADIKVETALQYTKMKLRHYLSKVDYYFDLSRAYKFRESFGNQTLKDFAYKVLWSEGSIPDILNEMHDLFIPGGLGDSGFVSLMLESSMLTLLHDCNHYVSAQQRMYYIYIHLIISEMKALIVLEQSYMTQRLFEDTGYDYKPELNASKIEMENRVGEYYELFSKEMGRFPQQIRRCEVKPPQRGVNFIELEKFSRMIILETKTVIDDACLICPRDSVLHQVSLRTNTTVNNCRTMGTTLTMCRAEPNSPHQYLWWRDEDGNHYGPDKPCDNEEKFIGGFVVSPGYFYEDIYTSCRVCVCISHTNDVQENDKSAIWRISVTDQISDLYNNKVVTGVRFVVQDNALHLQIQQAQFSYSGMVFNNSGWKPLDVHYNFAGVEQVRQPMLYKPLRLDRKSLHLDDIGVPAGYVVTGLKFCLVGDSAFKLQLLSTQFELGSGNLSQSNSRWVDASTHPMRPEDYKRPRIEINMTASDDPTRASEFEYDVQSNKLIQFTHTDLHKDAGQTTIPLIDAQSIESQPIFPLGGIGLSYMGRDGFGGYLIPRVHTVNISNYLKYPIIHRDIPIMTMEIPSTTEQSENEIDIPDDRNQTNEFVNAPSTNEGIGSDIRIIKSKQTHPKLFTCHGLSKK